MTQPQDPKLTKKYCSETERRSFVQLRERASPLQKFWGWTGFKEKKLWDVLQLLIVPTALALSSFYFQETTKQRDLQIAQANREKDQQIADDRAKQEVLNRYFDQISALLFDRQLRTAKERDEVRIVARVRTLAALRELDGQRKGLLLRFLQEADLIQRSRTIINLPGANFYKADLRWVDLRSANLSRADFQGTDFREAELAGAQFTRAILWNTDLSRARSAGANLSEACLNSLPTAFGKSRNGRRFHLG